MGLDRIESAYQTTLQNPPNSKHLNISECMSKYNPCVFGYLSISHWICRYQRTASRVGRGFQSGLQPMITDRGDMLDDDILVEDTVFIPSVLPYECVEQYLSDVRKLCTQELSAGQLVMAPRSQVGILSYRGDYLFD